MLVVSRTTEAMLPELLSVILDPMAPNPSKFTYALAPKDGAEPDAVVSFVAVAEFPLHAAAVDALPAEVAVVAEVALVAEVAVAAFPEMLMFQVPEAPVPVGLGTFVPIVNPRLVLAALADDAPVPPFPTGTALTNPSVASSCPDEFKLLASCDKLNA